MGPHAEMTGTWVFKNIWTIIEGPYFYSQPKLWLRDSETSGAKRLCVNTLAHDAPACFHFLPCYLTSCLLQLPVYSSLCPTDVANHLTRGDTATLIAVANFPNAFHCIIFISMKRTPSAMDKLIWSTYLVISYSTVITWAIVVKTWCTLDEACALDAD